MYWQRLKWIDSVIFYDFPLESIEYFTVSTSLYLSIFSNTISASTNKILVIFVFASQNLKRTKYYSKFSSISAVHKPVMIAGNISFSASLAWWKIITSSTKMPLKLSIMVRSFGQHDILYICCWFTVYDIGPELKPLRVNVSCSGMMFHIILKTGDQRKLGITSQSVQAWDGEAMLG